MSRTPLSIQMQCNHRSWADFMVDQYVTEGRTVFFGRWAVAAAFPLVLIPLRAIRCAILFKRRHIADIEVRKAMLNFLSPFFPRSGYLFLFVFFLDVHNLIS